MDEWVPVSVHIFQVSGSFLCGWCGDTLNSVNYMTHADEHVNTIQELNKQCSIRVTVQGKEDLSLTTKEA